MKNPLHLWTECKQAFMQQLENVPQEQLQKIWDLNEERAAALNQFLLPGTAHQLNCYLVQDIAYPVGFAFFRQTEGGYHVPLIFFENDPEPTHVDAALGTLCSLGAPIKIILTHARWSSDLWASDGGQRERFFSDWDRHIREHVGTWPQMGIVTILVAEWADEFRITSLAWDQLLGDFIEDKMLFSRYRHDNRN
jgi:hypothetical protein